MRPFWSKTLAYVTATSLLILPSPRVASAQAPSVMTIIIDKNVQHYDVVPYVKNNRTMVPLRGIFETLGATVTWTPSKPLLIVATKGSTTITMTMFQSKAQVNGQTVTLDQPSEVKNNRTFVPVRFVTEALGCDVTWDPPTNDVNILSGVYPVGQYTNRQAVNITNYWDPVTLDSVKAEDDVSQNMIGQIGEGLTRLDSNRKPIPGVAQSWTVSDDGKTYTFTLRPNAKWSDGSALTAQDFVYAWRRMLDPQVNAPFAYLLTGIQGGLAFNQQQGSADQVAVKSLDSQTLQVTLTNPMPYFLIQTATPPFFPQKQLFVAAQDGKYGSEVTSTLSNGPFLLRDWVHGRYEVLTRNPYYWNSAAVKLDKVGYFTYKYTGDAERAYNAGQIDYFRLAAGTQFDRLKISPEFHLNNDLQNAFLSFNVQNAVLKNANIRKALTYAVDGDAFAITVYDDGSTGATGIVPGGTADGIGGDFRTDNGDVLKRQANAAQAKTLLQQGLTELGLSSMPTLELLLDDTNTSRVVANFLQNQWSSKLGISFTPKYVAFSDRLQLEQTHAYTMALELWGADYNDPMTFLEPFVTNNEYNSPGYSNTQYDQLIATARNETDPTKRLQDLKDAETMLIRDMPVGPLQFRRYSFMVKPYVKGMITHPFEMMLDYDLVNAYIEGK